MFGLAFSYLFIPIIYFIICVAFQVTETTLDIAKFFSWQCQLLKTLIGTDPKDFKQLN